MNSHKLSLVGLELVFKELDRIDKEVMEVLFLKNCSSSDVAHKVFEE